MKLEVKPREKVGKKVKVIREQGFIPVAMYGPSMESTNLKVERKPLISTLREAGYSRLIDVKIDGKSGTQKALVKEVQLDPVSRELYHVSFYAVDMNKEIDADVPLEVTGVAPAVKNGIGVLEIVRNNILIRCLPGDLPPKLEVDISGLKEIGDHLTGADLNIGNKVELVEMTEDMTLVSIAEPQKLIIEKPEDEDELEGEEGEEDTDGEGEDTDGESSGDESEEK